MTKQTIAITLDTDAGLFLGSLKLLHDRYNRPMPKDKDIKLEKLVFLMLDDILNRSLKWVSCQPRFDHEFSQQFPWFDWMGETTESADILFYSIDPLEVSISLLIEGLIPEPTWNMWSLKRTGRFDFVLTSGEDFRIADWERRMSKGEWRLGDSAQVQRAIDAVVPAPAGKVWIPPLRGTPRGSSILEMKLEPKKEPAPLRGEKRLFLIRKDNHGI